MSDHIRAKLEALINDSGMFHAGQQEERRRLQTLVDARIDQLRAAPSCPHVNSICNELLRLRQSFEP
jgi:hypothetical protein